MKASLFLFTGVFMISIFNRTAQHTSAACSLLRGDTMSSARSLAKTIKAVRNVKSSISQQQPAVHRRIKRQAPQPPAGVVPSTAMMKNAVQGANVSLKLISMSQTEKELLGGELRMALRMREAVENAHAELNRYSKESFANFSSGRSNAPEEVQDAKRT